ncbi:polysaccharide biosynthesis protein [Yaniella halotolerans]|uniref:polysaccharide biosynthesis protein n=1 Tax=Yaniella halotolerans TaxID=225453 RepID=UPI0003B73970|nr:nucleoside-diphosphate sugar epimerase/dehydratase [Yaniella halotolerans]
MAIFGASLIYYDFVVTPFEALVLVLLALVASAAQLLFGWGFFLYRKRFSVGSFDEVRALLKAGTATGLTLFATGLITGYSLDHPVAVGLIVAPVAVVLMFGLRFAERLRALSRSVPDKQVVRTLVIGAGEAGTNLIRQMVTTPGTKYWPVGLVDDAPEKSNVQVYHAKVMGKLTQLPQLINQTGVEVLVVAVASPSKEMLGEVQRIADEFDLQLKIIPPLDELLERGIRSADLRDLSIYDLLGRAPVETNVEEIAGYLTGARVLVTGAGGSIGSVLCQQISRFHPAELIMLDRDETGLQHAQLTVNGNGLLSTKETVLADIRDAQALREVFEAYRPEVVFHAAALKHLPMLERYPEEGWKTNVLGTLNVLEASESVQVERFVNISTDKAANPTSQLGYSKQAAEQLTSWMDQQSDGRYLSVRFGNVIGSRGSMLPTFTNLIEQGGPLTVTHPNVTRYFMTIPEACQLVLQAGGIGNPGEVLILDMGEPVRILDVAKRMISLSGKDIDIVFTGLRQGEKLHEELTSDHENAMPSAHPLISRTEVAPLSITEIGYLTDSSTIVRSTMTTERSG